MLYGRDDERARIGALLDGARDSRSGALIVRGEAGVGKSALLEDARERAADMQVLTVRGVESESELPFAGLHQLVRPSLQLLDRLPRAQADALRGALGLAERSGEDRFLISAACLSLLSEAAERRPVLCLIDDCQWLDTPSADALLFAARRLDAEGIVILFAARSDDVRDFVARGVPDLMLDGLDARAAAALVTRRANGAIAPSVCDVLVEQAGGNALALVELPAALTAVQLTGAEPLPQALPLTHDVRRLLLERVRRLPEPAQQLLLIAAADDLGELALVMRAGEALGLGVEALDAAERSKLISVHGSTVVVRHPLIRSAVYEDATSSERRAVHLALADALTDAGDADRRAWHRAAAAVGPDPTAADELQRTAERARLRSGHAAAATALERAAQLSPDPDSHARRLVAAASSAWRAGQPSRASALVERARPLVADGALRAELDHVRGDIAQRCGSLLEAGALLIAGAEAAARVDTRRALDMLFDAASCGMQSGDYALVVRAGERAATLPRSGDEEERFLADLLVGVGSLWLGTTTSEVPLMLDVLARADAFDKPRLLAGAAMGAGTLGDEAREAELLRRSVALARASGAFDALTLSLLATAMGGMLAGRFAVAAEAAEGLRLAREASLTGVASLHVAILVWLAAARGDDDDECRRSAAEVAESASATRNALAYSIAEWGLALLDLGGGRPDEAVTRLVELRLAPLGTGHPLIALMSAPDLVEAAIRTGREEEARAAFATFEPFAQPAAPAWALALAARCRALLSEADADAAFAEAIRLHAAGNRPFDSARTGLLFGEHLRRRRRRVEARTHLRAALATFERLSAARWAERARSELRASGESARKRDPSARAELTPQELQIASFVAEGLSNKEVAAQLFLSPRTIDAHLRNVFAKLGLTSRTQLARVLRSEAEIAVAVSAS